MPSTAPRPMPDTYFELVRRFPLVRIAGEAELDDALSFIDQLLAQELDAGGDLYLDTLTALVQAYEAQHHAIPDASPDVVLRELAEANGLTGAVIAERTGIVVSTISALMSGEQIPTPEQMTALGSLFHINPAVFRPNSGVETEPSDFE